MNIHRFVFQSKENQSLKVAPQNQIASLQEELTVYKMRHAEAEMSINDLRQRLSELNRQWQEHDRICQQSSSFNDNTYEILAHELLTIKMREAQTDCENKLFSQKIMDLETQKQVSFNQLKRQDDELQKFKNELEEFRTRENDLKGQVNEMKNNLHDEQIKVKEDSMMLRIREAENMQTIGDLRQKIAELEVRNQELITRGQILDDKDLEDKVFELQDEVRILFSRSLIRHSHSKISFIEKLFFLFIQQVYSFFRVNFSSS